MYNLPLGFQSEKILQSIGNFIGEFLASDEHNLTGVWRNYMRLRVSIDVRKPLKRRIRLKREGGEWLWVDFKYERLHNFCFICGILGHTDKICPSIYETDATLVTKPYGPWMKAPNRRNSMNTGDHWLRSGVLEIYEVKFGNSSTSAVAMAVDLENGVNHGTAGHGDLGKESVQATMTSTIETNILVTGCKSTCVDGIDEELIANHSMIVKETDVEYNYALILVDAKRRRSGGGPSINLTLEEHADTETMEMSEHSKNGPTVGPVFQAHRHQ